MCPHPPEYERPDTEQADGKDPEIRGRIKVLPEPYFLIDRASVTIYNIDERIEFEEHLHIIRF
jgi:hypothetical protein